MMKTTVALLVILVTITAARSQDGECLGMDCWEDNDCQCSETNTIICRYKENKCREMNIWDKIIRNKPCPRYFKKRCNSTDECHCSGKLICEHHECVKPKPSVDITARRY